MNHSSSERSGYALILLLLTPFTAFLQAAEPTPLHWTDRRPVAQLFISQQAQVTTMNPSGYLNAGVDVTTDTGRKAFRSQLMEYADRCISVMNDGDAQGMIVWDLEGYQQAGMMYVGDPRILPEYAPEMDEVADDFFKRFRDAGLRTGVCIRPNKIFLIPPASVAKWGKWGYYIYDDRKDDVVKELSERIAIAKKRWGCTLFYMDSNSYDTWEEEKKKNVVMPAGMLRELHRLHPDVLIIPEHFTPGGHTWTAQYRELRGGWKGTPEDERMNTKDAFSILSLGGGALDQLERNWGPIALNLSRGDAAFMEGWYSSPGNQLLKQLYREADFLLNSVSAESDLGLVELLAFCQKEEPVTRFCAVRALAVRQDKTALSSLHSMLAEEEDWLVRKEILVTLGNLPDAKSIPILIAEMKKTAFGHRFFALYSLMKIGEPVLPAALELARSDRAQERSDSARLLGTIASKPAVEALLTLMGDSDPQVKAEAELCFKHIPDANKMITPTLGETTDEPDDGLTLD